MTKTQEIAEIISNLNEFTKDDISMAVDASSALISNAIKKEELLGHIRKVKRGKIVKYIRVGSSTEKKSLEKIDIPVADRFQYIEDFTRMVAKGVTPSLLLTGQAGVGKTFTVTNTLEKMGLEEDIDFVVIKGHSSPMGMYRTMFQNVDKLIVYDDCDSALKCPISLNILKGALDSYGRRTICWMSLAADRNGLPESFDFEGSVIFISNLDADRVDSAVVSRTITANLRMTNDEIIDRMAGISAEIEKDMSMEDKAEVIDFLRENSSRFDGLSLRTFIQACRIRKGTANWKNMVLWTVK